MYLDREFRKSRHFLLRFFVVVAVFLDLSIVVHSQFKLAGFTSTAMAFNKDSVPTEVSPQFRPRTACFIAPPGGVAINVRDDPDGETINRLRAGREVIIVEMSRDSGGKIWARVKGMYKGVLRHWGWVFKAYLDC